MGLRSRLWRALQERRLHGGGRRVVVLGGGTGMATALRGLKREGVALTAIVSLAALTGLMQFWQPVPLPDTPALSAAAPLRVFIRSGPKTHGPGAHDHPRFLAEWAPLLNARGAVASGGNTLSFTPASSIVGEIVVCRSAPPSGALPSIRVITGAVSQRFPRTSRREKGMYGASASSIVRVGPSRRSSNGVASSRVTARASAPTAVRSVGIDDAQSSQPFGRPIAVIQDLSKLVDVHGLIDVSVEAGRF